MRDSIHFQGLTFRAKPASKQPRQLTLSQQAAQGQALQKPSFVITDWLLETAQHWLIFATQGQVGEQFIALFNKQVELIKGDLPDFDLQVGAVSLSIQQQILEQEIATDETDFQDSLDHGHSVLSFIENELRLNQSLSAQSKFQNPEQLLELTHLTHLKDRGFRLLSTGETRRLMLALALAKQPQILMLDDPYAGLDLEHQAWLTGFLDEISAYIQIMMVSSREEQLPECISHVLSFIQTSAQDKLEYQLSKPMSREAWLDSPILRQLNAMSNQKTDALITLVKAGQSCKEELPDPLIALHNAKVEYTDALIFKDVNWQIKAGEHWQIRGPNGCGKSTLLGLILGDHPQCYSNDIEIFGHKRGSGESIWQIKQNIGIVSSSLHLQYRVNCSALDVVLSGLFDSIGLYQKPSLKQIKLAQQWLELFSMQEYAKVGFKSLDYGQQRLLLIARALIKQPLILILDEPYQGLDFLSRRLIHTSLNLVAQQNLSQLLYVTHYLEDSLPAVQNFVDFVKVEQGYEVVLTV